MSETLVPPSRWRLERLPRWMLIGLCLALFLPGFFSLPPFDRDEARYAQASRQMIESGDFVDIRFQGEARHKKPVGIYWLQVAAVTAVNALTEVADTAVTAAGTIWPYRLPSLAGAIAAVLLTAWAGTPLFGRGPAWLGAAMLAACVVLGVEARMAKTDAVLLATIVAAQGALARVYLTRAGIDPAAVQRFAGGVVLEARDRAWAAVFWIAIGLAILIKGPVAPLVSVSTVLALALADREVGWLRRLRPVMGLAIVSAMVLPWLIAITLKSGGGFYAESVGHDWLGKILSGQEGKGLPPGYYLASFWVTFAPFAGFTLLALPWIWHHRRVPAVRFCAAWIIPTWLIFEVIRTKLLHYTLPVFPAIALLTAAATVAGFEYGQVRGPGRRLQVAAALLTGLVVLALPVGLAAIGAWLDQRLMGLTLVTGGAAAALAFAAYQRLCSGPVIAAGRIIAAMGVVYALCYPYALAAIDGLWVSRSLATAIAAVRLCPDVPVASAGYGEPSLVFLLGTATRLGDGAMAAGHLRHHPACGLAAVEARQEAGFREALQGHKPEALATITGFNYSNGKPQTIILYRMLGDSPESANRPGAAP